MNNYAVYDNGMIHIGHTIRRFLNAKRMAITTFALELGLTRGGLNHILNQSYISTDRLQQISERTGYNFFQLYCKDIDERLGISEPDSVSESSPPKRTRVILELEDGQVINATNADEMESIKEYLETQRKQWDAILSMLPDVAKRIAEDDSLNPGNMNIAAEDGEEY